MASPPHHPRLPDELRRILVVGFGITARAVTEAFVRRGTTVVVADDRPGSDTASAAVEAGAEFIDAPDDQRYRQLVGECDAVFPSPGVPLHHAVYRWADELGVAVGSEFDLAARWDDRRRPYGAVTGTNGKTTVTTLATAMLRRAGVDALDVGNTDTPMVAAVDDAHPWAAFVVEASSFRLERADDFHPTAAAFLNLAADHLDWHPTVEEYGAAKARIWANQTADDLTVVPVDDPLVTALAADCPGTVETFGLDGEGDHTVRDGWLVAADGARLAEVATLPRRLPHDLRNALAAAAVARRLGASAEAVGATLVDFEGYAHRIAAVGRIDGVTYYDDSKATTPHAVLSAVGGFDSVVLIAGGRNKGVDLGELADGVDRIRAVVAIGEAADDVGAVFHRHRPVRRATSMDDAVLAARAFARPGDAVLLSPACASFDWYGSYGERGDDFARAVRDLGGELETSGSEP